MTHAVEIADPRVFASPDSAAAGLREFFALARSSLGASTGEQAREFDDRLRRLLRQALDGDSALLTRLISDAPSVDVARHVWRHLDEVVRTPDLESGVALHAFAIPVVIVTGSDGDSSGGVLEGVVSDPGRLVALLREHNALGGNLNFALANALVGVDAIDIAQVAAMLARERLPEARSHGAEYSTPALEPAPIAVTGRESVHLRFVVGTALARSGAALFDDLHVGAWGIPFAQALAGGLAAGGGTVLALPRAPQRLLPAAVAGRSAQREVSAQLFASNAIRRIRASVGEPSAVISAHHAADAIGGGELRLSLSSVFEPRDAEGFRCPLYPLDRAADVAQILVDLIRDCRITDIRVLEGVHDDRVPATGLPLLFKPETTPENSTRLH